VHCLWLAPLFTGFSSLEAVGIAAAAPIDELDTCALSRVVVEHGNVGEAVATIIVERTRHVCIEQAARCHWVSMREHVN